jgi:alkyl sulfatase BDS1-like metallo-beta-lactamase superfamily hydrolase
MLTMDGSRSGDVSDRRDFADADRGLIGTLEPMVVTAADGRVVWDMDQWSFLDADCPDTAWTLSDTGEHFHMEVSNGALIHHPTATKRDADWP